METRVKGFGEEFTEYKFEGILDWLIKINDPRDVWKAQPTYLISEWTFITLGLLTFIHSQRVGGRFRWLWLGCIMHGLIVENVTFWTPELDNFWHSQTTVMLFGRRLPLHIIFLYPTFIYTATACVSRLCLGKLGQAVATGLAVVLIDIPYDVMAVKFVHWTWHDTDSNIYDRHYWVPYTSYYFHATFASTFVFMFHFWRRVLCNNETQNQWISDKRISRELLCTILTALCGMPGGVIQFLPLYHPLHDSYGIHTENCVIVLIVLYFLIAWNKDRNPVVGSRPNQRSSLRNLLKGDNKGYQINELVLGLVLHYAIYLGMAIYGVPENEISVGLHEKIGPCDQWTDQKTVYTLFTGQMNKRRNYLCLKDYDEQYFDFKCLPKEPKEFSSWYTICGMPFANRAEYIQVIGLTCLVALFMFRAMLFASAPEWNIKGKSDAVKTKKHK